MSDQPVAAALEPFFFGAPSRQLYGCYHEPPTWPARDTGVVLCYPHGQEMIRAHRAFQQLAQRMARSGFPTLRFDFNGTGDSAGDGSDASVESWLADIRAAAAELQARSGVEHVLLAGLRLGASLAHLAAPALGNVAGLLLWEPVCSGAEYLEELRRMHEASINRFHARPTDYVALARPTELLGFPMPNALRSGIEQIELLRTPPLRGRPLMLLESAGAPQMQALADSLASDAPVTHEVIASFTVWVEDVDKGLVPQPLIEAIIEWLEATFP